MEGRLRPLEEGSCYPVNVLYHYHDSRPPTRGTDGVLLGDEEKDRIRFFRDIMDSSASGWRPEESLGHPLKLVSWRPSDLA